MKKNKKISNAKIEFFQIEILKWFEENARKFLWRNKRLTNYQYVIAEVLLQRTKAETVAKFYPLFIKKYPNWKSLADTDLKQIKEFLKPVGLYNQRSIRVKKLAVEMVKRNGRLPKNRVDLESIPFMGQYIANAVELVIFNQPSPLVDVNMARVLERFFGPRKMADIRYDPYLQKLSTKIVNHENAKEMNWSVLDFAAAICKPKPICVICPISTNCVFYESII